MNVIWDMTIGEIGQIAGLSTAVVVSLILGVKALRQTRDLQDRERRQMLLNEIVEWAIAVLQCGTPSSPKDLIDLPVEKVRAWFHTQMIEGRNRYLAQAARAVYIIQIGSSFKETKLSEQIVTASKNLSKYIERFNALLLTSDSDDTLEGKTKAQNSFSELLKEESELRRSLVDVVSEAVRVMTK